MSADSISVAEDRINIVELLTILWAHKLLIVGTTMVCGAVAVVLALTATPVYRAEVAVTEVSNVNMGLASSMASQFGGLANLVGVNLSGMTGANRQASALLKSRNLVEEFVKRHNLQSVMFEDSDQPPTLWFAVERFRKGVVNIREDKRAGTTVIAISWTDPAIAAKWANEFIALANDLMRKRAMDDSQKSIDYLNEQLKKNDVVEIRRAMFNLIENETKTLMLANAREEYSFAVIDPAVPPERRTSPRRTLMVLLGMVVGGFIGTLAAFGHSLYSKSRAAKAAR